MCKVMEDMRREEREAGIREGEQRGIKIGEQKGRRDEKKQPYSVCWPTVR